MAYNDYNYNDDHLNNGTYRYGYGGYTDLDQGIEHRTPPDKKRGGGNGKRRAIALVLCCVLAGGGAGVGGAALYSHYTQTGTQSNIPATAVFQADRPAVQSVSVPAQGEAMTPAELYAANVASCVGITVQTTQNYFGQVTSSAASGSGFVVTQDGYIVTNFHVVEAAAYNPSIPITVSFKSGESYTAKLVGYEADNDVAVLKIDATGLTPVILGDSDQLVEGQPVMAIGNPLGELDYSITDGLVSALDRLITDSDGKTMNMFQTNCAINPGNSGGPLFNEYGEVIGITTAKYTNSSSGTSVEGLGFAIPINDLKTVIPDLIAHGYVTGKPYMGVMVGDVPEVAQRYGVVAGAAIDSVEEGGAADKAGLQSGDIIIAIDDTSIDSASALTAALTAYRAGDSAELHIVRGNNRMSLRITFDDKNEVAAQAAENQQTQQETQQTPQSGRSNQDAFNDFFSMWPFYG